MPYFITNSKTPLLMETVPVLKITHYLGNAKRDNVYTYMRCYAYGGDLHCSFTCFDECPEEDSRVALSLSYIDSESVLQIVAGKYTKVSGNIQIPSSGNIDVNEKYINQSPVTTGSDEQGDYWSVNFTIGGNIFKKAFNVSIKNNTVFVGNFFIYSLSEKAFGSAFGVPQGESALTQKGADSFIIVPY